VTFVTAPGKAANLCDGQEMATQSTPPQAPPTSTPSPSLDLSADLAAVASSLHAQYDANLGHRTVDAEIRLVADRFSTATVRAFVPLFVRRFAGATLRGQSQP
jgi:hypothetical protein